MTRILIATFLAAFLSLFEYGWRLPVPPVDIAPQVAPALAAPLQSAPPCTPIGATGNIVISRCEDEENGMTIYVNNIGFLDVVE